MQKLFNHFIKKLDFIKDYDRQPTDSQVKDLMMLLAYLYFGGMIAFSLCLLIGLF